MDDANPFPYPLPTAEEIERHDHQVALLKKATWTREDCEAAVTWGLHTREEVEAWYHFLEETEGFDLVGSYHIEMPCIDISRLPRLGNGGRLLPRWLGHLRYQGKSVDYLDSTMPPERQWVQWIGRDRTTGQIVAQLEFPEDTRDFETLFVR